MEIQVPAREQTEIEEYEISAFADEAEIVAVQKKRQKKESIYLDNTLPSDFKTPTKLFDSMQIQSSEKAEAPLHN